MPNRVERLAARLREGGYDALVAHDPVAMTYLAGFGEDAHERFLALVVAADGRLALVAPALSATQARKVGIADVRPWRDGEDPVALFRALAAEFGFAEGRVAVDGQTPARTLLKMQSALPGAIFEDGTPVLGGLMRAKDAAEIALLRRAASIADAAWEEIRPRLRVGMTEREVAEMTNEAMASRGGVPTFCIVAAGAGAAEPHHLTGDDRLTAGTSVLLDFGCSVEGYQSDITRVTCLGEVPARLSEVYAVVLEAHAAAARVARAGVTAGEVDAAARAVIETAGYAEFFPHRTGHGIGMHGHEEPYVAPGSEVVLAPGDCFSIEPGIYLPGELGVRIENIYTISEDGSAASLNAGPPEAV